MVLHDIRFYGEKEPMDIRVDGRIITAITAKIETNDPLQLSLDGAIVLPGLINSHDHLEFNCYPKLGNRIYNSYTEWGPDIQRAHIDTIRQIEQIPKPLRIAWGLYKNLFNGFTTVVNHGSQLRIKDDLISVFRDCISLHSASFEKNWKWKLKNPFARKPFVMHVGEGTDEATKDEVGEITRNNLFRKKIVAVHGVALQEEQAASFHGLVWCPSSNYFLLEQTAAIDRLKDKTNVVFGTDSTLTSDWEIRAHFQSAFQSNMVTGDELLSMLTEAPADLWKTGDRGRLKTGKTADIIVIKPGTRIFELRPDDILLVIHRGKIRLADVKITGNETLTGLPCSKVRMGDSVKQVQGHPFEIAQEIKNYYPALSIPFTKE